MYLGEMVREIPNLRGRFFNVALCADCWDIVNPERKMADDQRRDTHERICNAYQGQDTDVVADNRCPVCDEQPHWGIYVRVNVEKLREMRKKVCG